MESELDPKKTELLDKVAKFISDKGIGPMAIVTLESSKPLHYLGSQTLTFFEPFLNMLINGEKLALFRDAMEDKRYIDYLVAKIEEIANE